MKTNNDEGESDGAVFLNDEERANALDTYAEAFDVSAEEVEQDVNRELVKYMRGDSLGTDSSGEAIDTYLHTYYEDIEQLYRDLSPRGLITHRPVHLR